MIALIYKLNENNLIAVKTPVGITERINIKEIVQQGGTWGPITCSNHIDEVGKESEKDKNKCYLTRNM